MSARPKPARRSAKLALACAALAVSGALIAAPAIANAASSTTTDSPRRLLFVSTDGVNFTATNRIPLFADRGPLVPGDADTASVWVRSGAAGEGLLRIDLRDPIADDDVLAAAVAVTAVVPRTSTAAVSFEDATDQGSCTVLTGERVLAPGETVRVDLTLSVDGSLTGDDGEGGSIDFSLRGVLADAGVAQPQAPGEPCAALPVAPVEPDPTDPTIPTDPAEPTDPTSPATPTDPTSPTTPSHPDGTSPSDSRPAAAQPGTLPHTGGVFSPVGIGLAVAGIVGGMIVMLVSRRRREDSTDA